MATNPYYNNYNYANTQSLVDSLVVDAIKAKGIDVNYLIRDIVGEYDHILGEAENYEMTNANNVIEMYLENVEQWGGAGNLFSKFGVEIHDQATFIVSKSRFEEVFSSQGVNYPREGDYIWFPFSKSMFQITEMVYDYPFWQFGNNSVYVLKAELATFANEDFDTGNTEIQTEVEGFEGDANTSFIPFDNPYLTDEEEHYIDHTEENPYSL